MRKEIYLALAQRLLNNLKLVDGLHMPLLTANEVDIYREHESVIKHVDLWNNNVEFIEEDEIWARPAVFIEFAPIKWQPLSGRGEYTTKSQLSLHVVTDWKGSASVGSLFQADSLEVFDLLNEIHLLLQNFSTQVFEHLQLVESRTNHNHEEILENVEVYEYRGTKWV